MQELAAFINSKISVQSDDLQLILSKFNVTALNRGQVILKTGQVANSYYFIKSGALRFYFGEGDDQLTAWVVTAGEFFAEISSLGPQVPTRFTIEAIEQTTLFCIAREDMEILYKTIPAWQEFGRITWENMAIRMINQIISFQTLSAEERYLEFMQNPELMKRVPVKHIASYLGITPNALSRIRKNIR